MSKRKWGTGSIIKESRGLAIRWSKSVVENGRRRRKMQYEFLGKVGSATAERILSDRTSSPGYEWLEPVCGYLGGAVPCPPPSRRLRPQKAHVYFVRNNDSGLVKVGFSTDVPRRMRTIQSHSGSEPELLEHVAVDHGPFAEKWFHLWFSNERQSLEWFRLSVPEIQDAIRNWNDPRHEEILAAKTRQQLDGIAHGNGDS